MAEGVHDMSRVIHSKHDIMAYDDDEVNHASNVIRKEDSISRMLGKQQSEARLKAAALAKRTKDD